MPTKGAPFLAWQIFRTKKPTKVNHMKILIFPETRAASAATAGRIVSALQTKPTTVLGMATGGTMEPVYAQLCAETASQPGLFSQCHVFNLDEYVGLNGSHPQSYHHYMRKHLFDAVGLAETRAHMPKGDAAEPEAEAARYETQIAALGGIDLQILGLGANGHIGFNEPSSSLSSRTRIKTLTRKTVSDNARFFGEDETIPNCAITMGIGTILEAKQIVLLATGSAKSNAVAQMIEGPVAAICPASALQFHADVTVILDDAAAKHLKLREYYETVHPSGRDA
jgi:glucosamine-6-phosphate deaminase